MKILLLILVFLLIVTYSTPQTLGSIFTGNTTTDYNLIGDLEDLDCNPSCGPNGGCEHNKCVCLVAFFGDRCDVTVASTYPRIWEIRNLIFTVLFLVASVFAIIHFLLLFSPTEMKSGILVKILIFCVFLSALIRTLYVSIDPWSYKGIIPPIVSSLMYQFAVGFLIMGYGVLVAFWANLYNAASKRVDPQRFRKRFYFSLLIINALIWAFLIPCAILFKTVKPSHLFYVSTTYTGFMASFITLHCLFFFYYGVKLYRSRATIIQLSTYSRSPSVTLTSQHNISSVNDEEMASVSNLMFFNPEKHRMFVNKLRQTSFLSLSASLMMVFLLASFVAANSKAYNYTKTPYNFIIMETIWRGFEWLFQCLILVMLGRWLLLRQIVQNLIKYVLHGCHGRIIPKKASPSSSRTWSWNKNTIGKRADEVFK